MSGREPSPRAGRSADDDENESFDLADAMDHAIETVDARRLVELLETEVVVGEGAERDATGGYPLEALEIAPTVSGYRDRPALPLWRAVGEDRVSAHLVALLANAHARSGGDDAARWVARHTEQHPELLARIRDRILKGYPHLVAALDALAPGSARLDATELRDLARALRSPSATAEEVIALAPRLALGLPRLKKKDRDSLAAAVAHLAGSSSPQIPSAIEALAEAGVPLDRELRSVRPIEAATLAGLVDNVRALERLGARPPRPKVLGRGRASPSLVGSASKRPSSDADPPTRRSRWSARMVGGLFGSITFATLAAGAIWGGVALVVAYVAPLHLFVMSQLLEEESVFHPLTVDGWPSLREHGARMVPPVVLLAATLACGFLAKWADPSILAAVAACLVVATFLATRRGPAGSGDEASRRA